MKKLLSLICLCALSTFAAPTNPPAPAIVAVTVTNSTLRLVPGSSNFFLANIGLLSEVTLTTDALTGATNTLYILILTNTADIASISNYAHGASNTLATAVNTKVGASVTNGLASLAALTAGTNAVYLATLVDNVSLSNVLAAAINAKGNISGAGASGALAYFTGVETVANSGFFMVNAGATERLTGPVITVGTLSNTAAAVFTGTLTFKGENVTTNGTNIGGGCGILQTNIGGQMQLRTLVAGSGVSLATNSSNVTISATGGSVGANTQVIFNNSGTLSGSDKFQWDGTQLKLRDETGNDEGILQMGLATEGASELGRIEFWALNDNPDPVRYAYISGESAAASEGFERGKVVISVTNSGASVSYEFDSEFHGKDGADSGDVLNIRAGNGSTTLGGNLNLSGGSSDTTGGNVVISAGSGSASDGVIYLNGGAGGGATISANIPLLVSDLYYARIKMNVGTNFVVKTNWVLGQRYTNSEAWSGMAQRATAQATIVCTAAVAAQGQCTLYSLCAGQPGITNQLTCSAQGVASLVNKEILKMDLSPNDIFWFQDESSGAGASVSILANSGSWIGQ